MSTVIELPDDLRDVVRRDVNRGLMIRFINADLVNRADLDVRKSFVFYDEDGLFEAASNVTPSDGILAVLYTHGIRYYSKGI